MNRRSAAVLACLFFCSLPKLSPAQSVKSPEQYFGFKMGADHKLVKWPQIFEYFNALGASSNKVKIIEAGLMRRFQPEAREYVDAPGMGAVVRLQHVIDRIRSHVKAET